MKRLFYYLFLVAIMCSCSEDVLYDGNTQATLGRSISTFSFDSITNKSTWRSYSFKQKFDVCQIPDSILPELTTKELVEFCATNPMNPLCYACDNPMVGARYIMKHFNGFAELKKRTDAAEELLNFYEGIDFKKVSSSPYPITIECNNKLYRASIVGFIEFILASEEIPSLNNKHYISRLDQLSKEKYVQKLEKVDVYGSSHINNSLMVQSKVALKSKMLSAEDKDNIQIFYNSCGRNSDISIVSKILFK